MKVAHLITGLNVGGAETALFRLLSGMERNRFKPIVIALMDGGAMCNRVEALGVRVYSLGMQRGLPSLSAIRKLYRIIRDEKPNILQGWMYHGNLVALLAKLMSRHAVALVWNIRQCVYDLSLERRLTAWLIRLGAWLSLLSNQIIYNAEVSRKQHEALGFCPDKSLVIPNGFDTNLFRPDILQKEELRRELQVPEGKLLVGLIGRYHPMKDHPNFLNAAAYVYKEYEDVRFLMVGRNIDNNNSKLGDLILKNGLQEVTYLLGERKDIPRLNSGLDIAVLSSNSEGFPNVVGEAMASSNVCVVTDVGDAAKVLGGFGRVVAPSDPKALGNAILEMLKLSKEQRSVIGNNGRRRIEENYSLAMVVKRYEQLYEEIFVRCAG